MARDGIISNGSERVFYGGYRMKRIISFVLISLMLISALPHSASASKLSVDRISFSGLSAPAEGRYASFVDSSDLRASDGAPYHISAGTYTWQSAGGTPIDNESFRFEAGVDYKIELSFLIDNPTNAQFANSVSFEIDGVSPSEYSATVVSKTASSLTVSFSFTTPGDFTPKEIDEIYLDLSGDVYDGASRPYVTSLYDTFDIMSASWEGSFASDKTFVGGRTYTLALSLAGFKYRTFAEKEKIFVSLGGRSYDYIEYFDRGDGFQGLYLEFEFYIAKKDEIDLIKLRVKDLLPAVGNYIAPVKLDQLFEILPYKNMRVASFNSDWKNWATSSGSYKVESGERFRYGVDYSIYLTFDAKLPSLYRFTENTELLLDGIAKIYDTEIMLVKSDKITFRLTFYPKFPTNGATEDSPAECFSFEDLKGALEDPGIKYITLYDVSDPDAETGGNAYRRVDAGVFYPIMEYGTKILTVKGSAAFKYNVSPSSATKPDGLVLVTGDLTVKGDGSITYYTPDTDCRNAVFVNRGKLTFEGTVAVRAVMNGITSNTNFPCALNQKFSGAELIVNGGSFLTTFQNKTNERQGAVVIEAGSAVINRGTMNYGTQSLDPPSSPVYGLVILSGARTVKISGGEMHGILLPSGKTIASYTDSSTTVKRDGVTVSRSASTELRTGWIRFYHSLLSVNAHVNSPEAGEHPDFCGHVESYAADIIYISWYDSTSKRTLTENDEFISGHSYTVTMRLKTKDEFTYFPKSGSTPTVSAYLNYGSVTPRAVSGYDAGTVIEISRSLGTCPNTISSVDITVVPPVAGRYSNDTPEMNSTSYKLYPTDPVTWYDETARRSLSYAEAFLDGHSYTVSVWIKASDGYVFKTNGTDVGILASVNGNVAPVQIAYEQAADEVVEVIYNFEPCSTYLDKVEIVNYTKPAPGLTPYYDLLSVDNDLYTIESVKWYDSNGHEMSEGDVFDYGTEYKIRIKIVPSVFGTVYMHKFNNSTKVYLNNELLPSSSVSVGTYSIVINDRTTTPRRSDMGDDPLPGDINGDGSVDMKDVLLLRRSIAGLVTLTAAETTCADVNRDKSVDMKDVLLLRRVIAGLETI